MRLIGRLFVLFAVCALAAWAVWTFALDRSDMQRELFERAADARYREAQPKPVEAEAFRVTACKGAACVVVEAAGLTFLVGGGAGVADALFSAGLLRSNLDGVLLTGLSPGDTAGLADLAAALQAAGRTEPLPIYGAQGVLAVAEGADQFLRAGQMVWENIDAEDAEQVPALAAGGLVADPAAEAPVFDSGVVQIWRRGAGIGQSTFRIDYDGRSLVVAGCGATAGDIREAVRGTSRAFGVAAVASDWMLETEKTAAATSGLRRAHAGAEGAVCLTPETAITAAREARLSGLMMAPLKPAPGDGLTERLWREAVTAPADVAVVVAVGGERMDVTAAQPAGQ